MGFAFQGFCRAASQPRVYRAECSPEPGRERLFAGCGDGCVHWSTTVAGRSALGHTVAEVEGKPALFFGDSSGYLYGLDGPTGKAVVEAELMLTHTANDPPHRCFYQGTPLRGDVVPGRSDLGVARLMCAARLRGSVSAVQASDGKVVWKHTCRRDAEGAAEDKGEVAAVMGPRAWVCGPARRLVTDHGVMYVDDRRQLFRSAHAVQRCRVALQMSTEAYCGRNNSPRRCLEQLLLPDRQVQLPGLRWSDFDFASSRRWCLCPMAAARSCSGRSRVWRMR